MATIILEREEIKLSTQQERMLISGWGQQVYKETTVEAITYQSGKYPVRAYLAFPSRIPEGTKLPCILWNRGGYRQNGLIDTFTARGIFGQLASWGYVVLASMYRGSIPGNGEDDLADGAVEDIISVMAVADELPFADTSRWAMEGWSRGGFMALNVLRQKPVFRAVILSGAICDLNLGFENSAYFAEEILRKSGDPGIIDKLSPLQNADELPADTNYLIIHGANDRTVPPGHSINLAAALLARGCNLRLSILDGGDHFLRAQRKETERLRYAWLKKYM
jgi:dipeptidyl aminopeptidase/acylaminoacyl peptidase